MRYFNKFPKIPYVFEFPDGPRLIRVQDIALNLRIRKQLLNSIETYDEYDIEDGETLDIISFKLYGKPFYHWTIMLLNDRYDYIKDYPMSDIELQTYVEEKYGVGNAYQLYQFHGQPYYKDRDSNVVFKLSESRFNLLYPDDSYSVYENSLQSITNLEFETIENDKKRRIKVLNQAYLDQVVLDIQRLING